MLYVSMKDICKREGEGSYVLCDSDVCERKLECERREVSFVRILCEWW